MPEPTEREWLEGLRYEDKVPEQPEHEEERRLAERLELEKKRYAALQYSYDQTVQRASKAEQERDEAKLDARCNDIERESFERELERLREALLRVEWLRLLDTAVLSNGERRAIGEIRVLIGYDEHYRDSLSAGTQGTVDDDGTEHCGKCGLTYYGLLGDTFWNAPNELWNEVEGDEGGLRCPSCFTRDCRALGIHISYRAVEYSRSKDI